MPLLVVPVGISTVRLLSQMARDEGIDLATLVAGLIQLAIGKQQVYLAARQHSTPVLPDGIVISCLNCGRQRTDSSHPHCGSCGGVWTRGYA
jgi:hypothetical protein